MFVVPGGESRVPTREIIDHLSISHKWQGLDHLISVNAAFVRAEQSQAIVSIH
jgi:hypothetical protein